MTTEVRTSSLILVASLAGLATLAASGVTGLGCNSSSPSATTASDGGTATPLNCSADAGDWPMFGQNVCNTRATSSAGSLSPTTASQLAVKWTYTTGGDVSATPAVVGGQIYVPDWGGMVTRIDAATGQRVWARSTSDILGLVSDAGSDGSDLDAAESGTDDGGASAPTSAVRVTPVVTGGLVIFGITSTVIGAPGSPAEMVAVDQDTGALVWKTVLDTHPYAVIASSPVLDGGAHLRGRLVIRGGGLPERPELPVHLPRKHRGARRGHGACWSGRRR